eukprot:PhM_4_TR4665/c0_g2_i2/m.35297
MQKSRCRLDLNREISGWCFLDPHQSKKTDEEEVNTTASNSNNGLFVHMSPLHYDFDLSEPLVHPTYTQHASAEYTTLDQLCEYKWERLVGPEEQDVPVQGARSGIGKTLPEQLQCCPTEPLVSSLDNVRLVYPYSSSGDEKAAEEQHQRLNMEAGPQFSRTFLTEDLLSEPSDCDDDGETGIEAPAHFRTHRNSMRSVVERLNISRVLTLPSVKSSDGVGDVIASHAGDARELFLAFQSAQISFLQTLRTKSDMFISSGGGQRCGPALRALQTLHRHILEGVQSILSSKTLGGILRARDMHDDADVLVAAFRTHLQVRGYRKVFDQIDANGNGFLDLHEFRAFATNELNMTQPESDKLFSALDLNGSGMVVYGEFAAPHIPTLRATFRNIVLSSFNTVQDAFATMDRNKDGALSLAEFLSFTSKLGISTSEAEALFICMDFDDDKHITLSELTRFVSTETDITASHYSAFLADTLLEINDVYFAFLDDIDAAMMLFEQPIPRRSTASSVPMIEVARCQDYLCRAPFERLTELLQWLEAMREHVRGDDERSTRRTIATLTATIGRLRHVSIEAGQLRDVKVLASRIRFRDPYKPDFNLLSEHRVILFFDRALLYRPSGRHVPCIVYLMSDVLFYYRRQPPVCRRVLLIEHIEAAAIPNAEHSAHFLWMARSRDHSLLFLSPTPTAREKWLHEITLARDALLRERGMDPQPLVTRSRMGPWFLPQQESISSPQLCETCGAGVGQLRRGGNCAQCAKFVCMSCSTVESDRPGRYCWGCDLHVLPGVRAEEQRQRDEEAERLRQEEETRREEEERRRIEEAERAVTEEERRQRELDEMRRLQEEEQARKDAEVRAVERRLNGKTLMKPDRVLVYETSCTRYRGTRMARVRLFLFSDCLVVAKESLSSNSDAAGDSATAPLTFALEVALHRMRMVPHSQEVCTFSFLSEIKCFGLVMSCEEDARLWHTHFSTTLTQHLSRPDVALELKERYFFDLLALPKPPGPKCMSCSTKFGFFASKLTCLRCGVVVCHRCSGGKAHVVTGRRAAVCVECLVNLRKACLERFPGCFRAPKGGLRSICSLCNVRTYAARCHMCLGDMCEKCCAVRRRVPKLDPDEDILLCDYCDRHTQSTGTEHAATQSLIDRVLPYATQFVTKGSRDVT